MFLCVQKETRGNPFRNSALRREIEVEGPNGGWVGIRLGKTRTANGRARFPKKVSSIVVERENFSAASPLSFLSFFSFLRAVIHLLYDTLLRPGALLSPSRRNPSRRLLKALVYRLGIFNGANDAPARVTKVRVPSSTSTRSDFSFLLRKRCVINEIIKRTRNAFRAHPYHPLFSKGSRVLLINKRREARIHRR